MKKIRMLAIGMLSIAVASATAQDAVLSAGGDASGADGTASYSVGQVIYTEATGSGGTSTQGVQQTYFWATGINENPNINLSLTVFPNPTRSSVTLKIDESSFDGFFYQLLDLNGKSVLNQTRISEKMTFIPLENLAASTYLLLVSNNQQIVKSFKITKNK